MGLLALTLSVLSPPALAYDTYLYYDPSLMTAADVSTLSNTFTGVGASVYTTTSTVWPTNYTGYRLVVLLMPAANIGVAQSNALTTMVNGGGRLIVSGDYGSAWAAYNNRINALMTNMGVPLTLNNTLVGNNCNTVTNIAADTITSGISQLYISASNSITGGTVLARFAGSPVLAVAQPASAVNARDPYDVILAGDTNLLLNTCNGSTNSTANVGFWENVYTGTCLDLDGDGYDDDSCGGTDCDDSDANVHPGGIETCDGVDEDCNGAIDDNAVGAATWYRDADGDSFGSVTTSQNSCSQPSGYVSDATDCNDRVSTIYPSAPEHCDNVDEDCDGTIDDNPVDPTAWYRDIDGDNYGDATVSQTSCIAPANYVVDGTDCDDRDANSYPGATEIPYDGIDQDCDGSDAVDLDGDGYDGTAAGGSDCWDTNSGVHAGTPEQADGVDEDCDGMVDEGTSAYDDDGDGQTEDGGDCDDRDPNSAQDFEELPDGVDNDCDGIVDEGTDAYDDDQDGYTEAAGDCNDADTAVHPGQAETANNGVDDNCDGLVDSGLRDEDEDGYAPEGGDCDDTTPDARPGAREVADGLDNDCDGLVDEGTSAYDDDGDGVSEQDGDCNDADAGTSPQAAEVLNGVDDNCDGQTDEGTDAFDDDGDGFSERGGDCDDADASLTPGGEDIADGIDNDCDGTVDEDTGDTDGDGVTAADGDCNDKDGWIWPGMPEMCDGLDNNCNGAIDEEACDEVEEKYSPAPGPCGCANTSAGLGLLPLVGALALRRRTKV